MKLPFEVGSEIEINVVIPVVFVLPTETDNDATIDETLIVFKPSADLYNADEIPEISIMSPSTKLWGTVLNAVTCLSKNEKTRFSFTISEDAIDTIFFPKTSFTLELTLGEFKNITSSPTS